jgi:acyl transferase domain-containing protein
MPSDSDDVEPAGEWDSLMVEHEQLREWVARVDADLRELDGFGGEDVPALKTRYEIIAEQAATAAAILAAADTAYDDGE